MFCTPVISNGNELSGFQSRTAEEDVVYKITEHEKRVNEKSPFGNPRAFISDIESLFRSQHPEFISRDDHVCYDPSRGFRTCSYQPLTVKIYRRRNIDGTFENHLCIPHMCRHTKEGHICNNQQKCWHNRYYAPSEVYTYKSLFYCTRSGRVHQCGYGVCREGRIYSKGLFVCCFTGMVLETCLDGMGDEPAVFDTDTGTVYDAFRYLEGPSKSNKNEEDYEMRDDDDDDEDDDSKTLDNGLHLYSNSEKTTEGGRQKQTKTITQGEVKFAPFMSDNEKEALRQLRKKVIVEVIYPFTRMGGGSQMMEQIVRPLRDFIKNSKTKEWPGHIKFAARLQKTIPRHFHPSWYRTRLLSLSNEQSGKKPTRKTIDPYWAKIQSLLPPIEADKIETSWAESHDELLAVAAISIQERLENTNEPMPPFDQCAPALLNVLKRGVTTETGVAVNPRKLEWLDLPRADFLATKMIDRIRELHKQGLFGDTI